MDRKQTEQFVHAFYESRLSNQLERCVEHFAPDAIFSIPGLPSPQTNAPAPPSVREQIADVLSAWRWNEFHIQTLLIDGNQTAVHYALKATFVPTNEELETELVDFLTIKNGKVTEYFEFIDTAKIGKLVEKAQR